ncbi:MAG: hypothetical protein WC188_12875 [Candidatus Caldatribacteriota bacterium]
MNRKTLRFNRFGESILSEFELFTLWINNIHFAYHSSVGKPNVIKVYFRWSWNDYIGIGEIYYYHDTKKLCNHFGENSSNMTISSNSKRQQSNGKHNCALYNDSSLARLFQKILEMINLDNPRPYPHE